MLEASSECYYSAMAYLFIICFFVCMQALASERELVAVLLDPDAIVDSGPKQFTNNTENGSGKTESDLMFVLDRIFEGVCRPFKLRVEQVLQSQPSLIVSYKLSNTLEFYCYTVSCLIFVPFSWF